MSYLHDLSKKKPDSESSFEVTMGSFFQQAIEAENLARDIYVQFSQMFLHVPDVSGFWQGLAYDEAKHADTLKKIQASLSSEQLAATSDRKLLRSVANTVSLMNKVSLEAIQTLDDAYEVAHELEFSEVNYVFKCVASDFITEKDRKKIVFSEIEEHQKKLVDFTENFGDRNWRRQISARSVSSVSSEK